MRRSLTYYWRSHLAVAAGGAVACAALTGALLVGDSLRGSLRSLALDSLGSIDALVVSPRPVGAGTADALLDDSPTSLGAAPALLLRGSATHGGSGARAADVHLLGIDDRFQGLFASHEPMDLERRAGVFPPVAISAALARELGASEGDDVVLSFEKPSDIPRETLVGRRGTEDLVESLRATVARVLPRRGPGGFSTTPSQRAPRNAYVDLDRLQRALFGSEAASGVNLIAVSGELSAQAVEARLQRTLTPKDYGLRLLSGDGVPTVQSRDFVLSDAMTERIAAAAATTGLTAHPTLTYLANSLRVGDRELAYSTVAGIPAEALAALTGRPPAERDVYLTPWSADALRAAPGDRLELDYYSVGSRDELSTETTDFLVAGVVPMEGWVTDPHLVPEFPGIEDAEDIASWDPPFPVDLDRITAEDEDYWDAHGTAPKLLLPLATAQEIWSSRFGGATSVRLSRREGALAGGDRERFEVALLEVLRPGDRGIAVHAARDEALAGARGATDFAGLFLGLSLFLILSALMLVSLLFKLGVERRSAELGTLTALGFPPARVRRRLLAEATVVAAAGATLGCGLAIGYAALLLHGLRTWWLPAIGEPVLFLEVSGASLAIGWLLSVAAVCVTAWLALRRLLRLSPQRLLAGKDLDERASAPGPWPRRMLVGSAVVALGSLAASRTADAGAAAGLAFLTGFAVLTAGLAAVSMISGRTTDTARGLLARPLVSLGSRNSARNRSRSLLSVGLVASAVFLLAVVAAYRGEAHPEPERRDSGTGGFTLWAESRVAFFEPPQRSDPRIGDALGQDPAFALRLVPGDDVSCLNLFQPRRPRLLGVPTGLADLGAFSFRQTLDGSDDAWALLAAETEEGVIPAIGDYNSVLWILKAKLGDEIAIQAEDGSSLRLRLVGLLEKSVFQSELLISEEALARHFPSRQGYHVLLASPPVGQARAAAEVLESRLPELGFDAQPSAERLAAFEAVEQTYLTTFQTLGGLGLALGTLGLGIVMLRNTLDRRRELATLAAFGYRRRRLGALVTVETAALLGLGLVVGLAAGALAAWPQLAASGATAPWRELLGLVALVAATGLASSLVSVAAVARLPLLEGLRGE